MIVVSDNYKTACESTSRKSYVVAKYGVYNKEAKSKINNVTSNAKPFANVSKTFNEIKDTRYNYISCELGRVKLDGNYYFISNKNSTNEKEILAYWSSSLSNANGLFATNPKIVYSFSENIEFTELTLYFQEVCEQFSVKYYLDTNLVAQRNVTNNSDLNVTTEGAVANAITYFNKIEIEFIKTGTPKRYIKFNEIDFGTYEQFTEEQIADYNIIEELNIDSSSLSSNSLNLTIEDKSGDYDVLNPNNKLKKLQERQEISLYHYLQVGDSFQELPLGTFLLKKFDSKKNYLEIEAYDDTYFMNKTYYGSNFYQNASIGEILGDLFNYFNYSNYVIDSTLNNIKLTGYVPNVEFREALRLICEAGCCVVSKTRYGVTRIYKTQNVVAKYFKRNMIFSENPSRNLFNNVVDVVEYNFGNKTEKDVEIYNAELSVGEHTILYTNFPVDETTIKKAETNENYTIIKAYATSCVVNVLAQTKVILKAILYSPTNIVKRITKTTDIVVDDYAISKVDNCLITSENAKTVGDWKLSRKDIKYNFDTLQIPYVELGDTCTYQTAYNTNNTFTPTRIEFTKSIKQNFEGE